MHETQAPDKYKCTHKDAPAGTLRQATCPDLWALVPQVDPLLDESHPTARAPRAPLPAASSAAFVVFALLCMCVHAAM